MTTTLERAFTADRVLRLSGLSRRQLQYWEDTGLIRSSLSRPERRGHGRPRLYAFRDLVELRTAATLRRDGISLQLIRKVHAHLRTLDYEQPLADVAFQVVEGELVFLEAGTVRTGRRPEQVVIAVTHTVPLREIVDDLQAQVAVLDVRQPGEISRRRGVLGGKPVIAGTRISVATVLRLVAEGLDLDGIRELYPDLTAADVEAAGREEAQPARLAG